MPKKVPEITPVQLKRPPFTELGFHAVGGVAGLHLRVREGPKYWVLRAMVGNRRRDIGLGSFPETSLAQARELAREARQKIRAGIDPIEERQEIKQKTITEAINRISFRAAAKEYHPVRTASVKRERDAKAWLASLERHAFPKIGNIPVMDLETIHIHRVLEPIWYTTPRMAADVRQRIEKVIDFTFVKKGISGRENPARWRGNLSELLPSTTVALKAKNGGKESHFPALPYKDIKRFMADLRSRPSMSSRALELVILTAARSGDVREATWGEIDTEANEWVVPAERMKTGREHIVPLSVRALEILQQAGRTAADDLIFKAPRGGPLSDMALTQLVRRMHEAQVAAGGAGYTDPKQDNRVATVHGFRSTFRDWYAEETAYSNEMGEKALAHAIGDKAEAAYRRGSLRKKRAVMMQDWADYCDSEPAAVTALHRSGEK